jgi:hypothetical protein
MKKEDWMVCADPASMLGFLADRAGVPVFRRFAFECCQRIGGLIPEGSSDRNDFERLDCLTSGTFEENVEIAEAEKGALMTSYYAAMAKATEGAAAEACAVAAVECALFEGGSFAAENMARVQLARARPYKSRYEEELRAQADLLRRLATPFK